MIVRLPEYIEVTVNSPLKVEYNKGTPVLSYTYQEYAQFRSLAVYEEIFPLRGNKTASLGTSTRKFKNLFVDVIDCNILSSSEGSVKVQTDFSVSDHTILNSLEASGATFLGVSYFEEGLECTGEILTDSISFNPTGGSSYTPTLSAVGPNLSINTTLVPSVNDINLGSSSALFEKIYSKNIFFHQSSVIQGTQTVISIDPNVGESTLGSVNLVGNVYVGIRGGTSSQRGTVTCGTLYASSINGILPSYSNETNEWEIGSIIFVSVKLAGQASQQVSLKAGETFECGATRARMLYSVKITYTNGSTASFTEGDRISPSLEGTEVHTYKLLTDLPALSVGTDKALALVMRVA